MSVSVIIPFYNSNEYLARAIKSCLIQPEVSQVVLVDDGSTDDGLATAQGIKSEESRIEIVILDKNHGRSYARNRGLEKVSSEYFSFLDADDYYEPKRFRKVVVALDSNRDIEGVYEAVKTAYEDNVKLSPFYSDVTMIQKKVKPKHLLSYLIGGEYGYFSIIGLTLRRSVLNYRFDESLEVAEDTDYIWRIVKTKAVKGIHANTISICRGVHGKNTAFNNPLVVSNRAALYKKWVFDVSHNVSKAARKKLLRSYLYYESLRSSQSKSRFLSKLRLLIKAVIKKPSVVFDIF